MTTRQHPQPAGAGDERPAIQVTMPLLWSSALEEPYEPSQHYMDLVRKQKKRGPRGEEVWEEVHNDYLTVAQRLVWFTRDQRALIMAGYAATTYRVRVKTWEEGGLVKGKAYVRDVLGNDATAEASGKKGGWSGGDVEKVGTKALGRALATLGYGTDAAPEMDTDATGELEDAADSPRPSQRQGTPQGRQDAAQAQTHQTTPQRAPTAPAPAQARPAPSSPSPTPPPTRPSAASADEALAVEKQVSAIKKLCEALGRPVPDCTLMTYAQARDHISRLSAEYQRARRAS